MKNEPTITGMMAETIIYLKNDLGTLDGSMSSAIQEITTTAVKIHTITTESTSAR